ncbi:hypothetical protein ACHHYP_00437 [Achlya hypogyna]|uniref:RING-type domain-containing protein n=1 Tax=Achlya hypogyna TaxID=1202772 RepID=A0A1V9ZUG9_ACHHY|nr:hypothetical protein ACHHYP_00437 [Achlya hypogyna]
MAASRSRNIDIPNSKPRARTKPAVVTAGRVAAPSPATRSTVAPSTDSRFLWHSRPPRGNLAPTPTTHLTSFQRHDDQTAKLKRAKKLKSASVSRRMSTEQTWEPQVWQPESHDRSGNAKFNDFKTPSRTGARLSEMPVGRPKEIEPLPLPGRSTEVVENLARALLTDCITKRQHDAFKAVKINVVVESTAHTAPPPPSSIVAAGHRRAAGRQKTRSVHTMIALRRRAQSAAHDGPILRLVFASWILELTGDGRDEGERLQDSKPCQEMDPMLPSSSPESDCFYEEKGLPKEVRYSLPIAYGTVHETSKECTVGSRTATTSDASICQLAYEIGSHIVTLTPCQHFFHALCVDKWLWNHTTCPLCRKEVVYEAKDGGARGTACPDEDRDCLRKKMRSQCTEFRPLNPVALDVQFSNLHVHDARRPTTSATLDHLVCPVAQRTWRK